MEFKCPHCGKSFELKTRKASTSAKANAARKRNAAFGGPKSAVPAKILATVYCHGADWKATRFMQEIEKATGHSYSLAQSCRLLEMIRNFEESIPSKIWKNDQARDNWFDEREAEGARTTALMRKDTDGVLSNSQIIGICHQALETIKKLRIGGNIDETEAREATAKVAHEISLARKWVEAYQLLGTAFRVPHDLIEEQRKNGRLLPDEADRALSKLRREHLAMRSGSTAEARVAFKRAIRVARPYLTD